MKEVYRTDDVIAYDGFKDIFGGKIFIVINKTMKESANLKYVWTPEYGEVIDITESTKRKIEKLFPGYSHTEWQITS